MNKSFAIFDMDGTLVDSMVYWQRLGREYLKQKGFTGDIEAVEQRVSSMTMTESCTMFVEELGIPGTPESVMAEMDRVMDNHYRNDVPLKPGVREYLDALKAKGVTLCVASATPEPLVQACLERLHVAEDFSFLLSCESVGAGKSSPAVYLEAARRMDAQPAQIAVYEDVLYAAATAQNAGFYTIGVYDAANQTEWPLLSALADESIVNWFIAAAQL